MVPTDFDDTEPESIDASSPSAEDGSPSPSSLPAKRLNATAPKRRQRKKPCHIAQKERKESLVVEMHELESRVSSLRKQAGVPSLDELQTVKAMALENARLRDAVAQQQMLLANTQASMSSYTNRLIHSPLSTPIHLPRDWQQRRKILVSMRDAKVCAAHAFLMERTRTMDPLQESCEESKFTTPDGGYVVVKLDNTPLFGVSKMGDVLQAMRSYTQEVEVSLSATCGAIMTREGEEVMEEGISTHRFIVSVNGTDKRIEKNGVGFTGRLPDLDGGKDDQVVVMTMDFVDSDELYPYRPNVYTRNDLTGIVQVRTHRTKDGELVAVMTRWYHAKLHCSALVQSESTKELIQDSMLRLLGQMVKEVKWHLQLAK